MKTGMNKTVVGLLLVVGIGGYLITPVFTLLLPAAATAQNIVEGKGRVIAVSPEKQQVVLEHGEIKGFMEPMTMGYKVATRSLLAEVNPGDDVRFSIDTQKSTIVSIEREEN